MTLEIEWIKASRSHGNGNCVELANLGDPDDCTCKECKNNPAVVSLRDSKNPNGPQVCFTEEGVRELIQKAKAGDFDHVLEAALEAELNNA